MWNASLDESQPGINIAGRNINNLRYADDTTVMTESKEELKSLLMRAKEESERAGLKLNIHKKTNIFVLKMCIEKQRHYSADKGPYSQGYDLSSSHVRIWKPDNKEGRATKSWCFRTVVLEKTPESPLDSNEIKLVSLKGNQP